MCAVFVNEDEVWVQIIGRAQTGIPPNVVPLDRLAIPGGLTPADRLVPRLPPGFQRSSAVLSFILLPTQSKLI